MTPQSHSPCRQIKTTCAYCGVGCGIQASVNDITRQVTVVGDLHHPANFGRLCSKGSSLGETLDLSSRLLVPQLHGQEVSWDTALTEVAQRFKAIIERYGPDAVAIYGSGQLLTEDYYVANKLMKGFIGSSNIDTNSRLCMSSSVSGHKRAFGSDTVPNCYQDFEQADLIVITGSNMAWCHPVTFQRIRAAKEANPKLKIVVIDPRQTATCDIADLHLPLLPGSDVTLFNGLLLALYEQDHCDLDYISQYTQGFDAAIQAAQADCPNLASIATRCGLTEADVAKFYQWFGATEKVVTAYSQGVNQSSSGTDKVNAILNCHLVTGRIGKSGCGPFSMTGQPNAMGGREVGGLATTLAAHMEFNVQGDIERVGRFWNSPQMANQPGLPAVALFDAVADGTIKAVWIMATNPVVSLPNADKVKQALSRCDFVVVSDCVAHTDTLAFAHVKLPAVGWSEKDGMVTNSERRISHQKALLPAAGDSKPDWWIITQVAQRMGYQEAFNYQHQVEIFREHAALSGFENNEAQRLRDFDISAFAEISLEAYQDFTPVQWPVNAQFPKGRSHFFSQGEFFTPNRKANILALTSHAPAHLPSKDYPLILNTGRLRDQWHTMTRTALSPRLNQHKPEPFVDIHPDDAAHYQLQAGHLAHIESHWGSMLARVNLSLSQARHQVFVPMHWTEQYASHGRMGALVNPAVDPYSAQPESKHTPIRIQPYLARWHGFALSRLPLTHQPKEIDYEVKVAGDSFGRYELAGQDLPESWHDWAIAWLAPHYPAIKWQSMDDSSQAVFRLAGFQDNQLMLVLCIANTPSVQFLPERAFLASLFSKEKISQQERLALLSGLPTAGVDDAGKQVCACFNVGEKTILNVIKAKGLTHYQQVGHCCKAGTNCGSCVPEIKALLDSVRHLQPA